MNLSRKVRYVTELLPDGRLAIMRVTTEGSQETRKQVGARYDHEYIKIQAGYYNQARLKWEEKHRR